jgi:hypothetical protein
MKGLPTIAVLVLWEHRALFKGPTPHESAEEEEED